MRPADRVWLLELKPVRRVTPSVGTVTSFYFCQGPPGTEDRTLNGVVWRKRLRKVFDWQVAAFTGSEGSDPRPMGGQSVPSVGSIVLDNADRQLDDLLASYAWCGVDYILRMGRTGDAWGAFTIVHQGWIADVEADLTTITLTPVDLGEKLARPVQGTLYLGTGTVEGGDDLSGRPKPLLWGRRQFFVPVLVDEYLGTPIYQIHDGAVQNIFNVRERGKDYGSVTSVADVYAWTPVAATVAADLTHGLIRLPSPPKGVITVEAIVNLPAHAGSGNSHANAMYEAATRAGVLASGDVDLPSFQALHTAEPDAIGYLLQEATPIAAVLDALCASCGAGWTWTYTGKLRVKRVAFGTPVATITDGIITAGPKRKKTAPPVWRIRRKWAPIRPHTEEELSPARDLPQVPPGVGNLSSVTGGDKAWFTLDTAVETDWAATEGAYIGRRVEVWFTPSSSRGTHDDDVVLVTNYHLEGTVARVSLNVTFALAITSSMEVRLLPETGLSADFITFAKQEWRLKDISNSTTLTRCPRARDVERAYYHVTQSDADSEAGRQRSLEGAFPDVFELEVRDRFLAYQLFDTLTVNLPRFGLTNRDCLVMGLKESADTERTTLTLWSQG